MKQFLYYFVFFSFTLFVSSCATTKITYDYDDNANFKAYTSFAIAEDIGLQLEIIDSTRFVKTMVRAIKTKGLKQSDTPDILVFITLNAEKAQNNTHIGVGIGQHTRNTGINIGGAIPLNRNATTQTLTLDFVDRKTNRLIWQSHAKKNYKNNLSPETKEQLYFEFFIKILEGYPPDKTKK